MTTNQFRYLAGLDDLVLTQLVAVRLGRVHRSPSSFDELASF